MEEINIINDGKLSVLTRLLYNLIISIILTKYEENIWIRRSKICNEILNLKDEYSSIKNIYQINGNLSHLCKNTISREEYGNKKGVIYKRVYNKKGNRCIWYFLYGKLE